MENHFGASIPAQQAIQIKRVLQAALRAADPRAAVRAALSITGDRLEVAGQWLNLSSFRRIRLVGAGKAAQAMACGLLDVLGERVSAGLLIAKHHSAGTHLLPERVRVLLGSHPVPSEESTASARALLHFLHSGEPGEEDLLFILISGGGSALMTLPVEGIPLEDLQELTRMLLASGADIGEINTLRKHLDQVKGGGLARLAAPARVITLILSDVIGSPLDVIASGPTVADSTTYAQAIDILRKYHIEDQAPAAIRRVLERGAQGELPETLKAGSPILERVTNQVVASNAQAAEAALAHAEREGFNTLFLTTYLQGEASQAGMVLAGILKQSALAGKPIARPACIVAGGETTVTLRGAGKGGASKLAFDTAGGGGASKLAFDTAGGGGASKLAFDTAGRGGRSQELALGAAALLAGLPDVALVAFGTDGEDGPTDAAGAVVTGQTLDRARELGLDPQTYLQNNDAYTFFSAMGDLLITGPTGTNVNDLVFLFAF